MKSPNQYAGPAALQGVRVFVAVFAGCMIGLDRLLRAFDQR